jgi:hypothetical protein
LAATAVFAHRLTGATDVVLGLPVAARNNGLRFIPGMLSNSNSAASRTTSADAAKRRRQSALPAGVAGIGLRQTLGDGEAVAAGLERAGKGALRRLHVANFLIKRRQIALPAGVAGIVAAASASHTLPTFSNAALPISEPGKRERDDRPGGEAHCEDVASARCAASTLAATKAWVSTVGSGAPRGREAIHRSASSRTGERSRSPPGRAAVDQRRAASPNSVCYLTQPMSVCSLGKPIGARLKVRSVIKKDEVKPPQRLRDRTICDVVAGDRREPLVERAAYATSFSATSEAAASGESTNTTVSALPISASMRFHQSPNP